MLVRIKMYHVGRRMYGEAPRYELDSYVTYIKPESIAQISGIYKVLDMNNNMIEVAHINTYNAKNLGLNGNESSWLITKESQEELLKVLGG